ncbi:MAG: cytochrome c family protein [Nitrospinota bacterium]|nr:cytochrome c family protein [Nitrospinota bacterium]
MKETVWKEWWVCLFAALVGLLILSRPAFGARQDRSAGVSAVAASDVAVPDTIILETLQEKYQPVMFDHKVHIQKASGCSDCHHHTSARETRKCGECHDMQKAALKQSLVEGFLPCKSCHRKYSPAAPSMPSLKTAFHIQCFTCHKNKDNIEGPKACQRTCHALAGEGG